MAGLNQRRARRVCRCADGKRDSAPAAARYQLHGKSALMVRNGCYYTKNFELFREHSHLLGVVERASVCGWDIIRKAKEGVTKMWISLFTFVSAAAIGLSVAAVMMQPRGARTLRG